MSVAQFYLFPFDRLDRMLKFVGTTRRQSHKWEKDLTRIFGSVHFLTHDRPTWVGGLKFYKIVRSASRAPEPPDTGVRWVI